LLEESGVKPGDRIVYANPAARWATKYWTIQGWADLADLLLENRTARVVFSGSPSDVDYITEITKRMKHHPISAAGKVNLSEAVALLEVSDAYIGVDSGPMHISAFTGTPVIALFGPTDPAKVGPYGDGHLIIMSDGVDCLACRKRSCSDRQCLEGITGQMVYSELKRHLGW
jgi:ADP-heptose:LPS heptosyltransferase